MLSIKLPIIKKLKILSLGAESAGVFAVYQNGNIFISENFGDLLEETNFLKYKKAVLDYFKKEKIKPDAIITDLHPLYKTTLLGEELTRKFKIPHIKVQHHLAHIFSSIGDKIIHTDKLQNCFYCHSERGVSGVKNPVFSANITGSFAFAQDDKLKLPDTFIGIAMDGTGYGLDGNIWGGEIFRIQIPNPKSQIPNKSQILISKNQITRIGSLEEQTMIGGDLAVREPARMLIAILTRIMNQESRIKNKKVKIIKSKRDIYKFVKKFYTRNEFEALYNQLEQGFNCQKTTSTGRVFDAASVLLGFAENERNYKHEAAKLLEENSTMPYNIEPRINPPLSPFEKGGLRGILQTTPLFEYLIKNINKDKRRLAATAQHYLAKGFYKIAKKNIRYPISNIQSVFAAGGLSNNKIISSYLENNGVYLAKKIPRGDEGIAVGQIVYYLLSKAGQYRKNPR